VSEVGGSDHIGFFRSGYAREYAATFIRCGYGLMHVTHITTRKMSMQQIIEMLAKAEADRKTDKEEMLARMKEVIKSSHNEMKTNQEDLLARMDAYYEKRMAMFDAYKKRIMA
jgi:hypothetical protein